VVELNTEVREYRRLIQEARDSDEGSQVVTIPPLEPDALLKMKESARFLGRKVLALKEEISESLLSWRQAIEGEAEKIASRTTVHLSESPNPRTFQDITDKFLTLVPIIRYCWKAPHHPRQPPCYSPNQPL
jgi:hypothetical protein